MFTKSIIIRFNAARIADESSDETIDQIDFDHDLDDIMAPRYSTDNVNFLSSLTAPRKGHRLSHRNKSNVVTRGIDFIRKMRWKSNEQSNNNRHLSQSDIEQLDGFTNLRSSWSTQNTPRGSIDNGSMPDELITPSVSASNSTSTSQQKNNYLSLAPIHESDYNKNRENYAAQYNRALHAPTRFLPQNQAVITTNGEGRVLLFNDIASLCFGINKLFIGESILNTLIEDPFRNQITRILDRRNNLNSQEQSEKGPVLVCGTIVSFLVLFLAIRCDREI